MTQKRKISFYVHWPFCESICGYCDFNRFLLDANLDRKEFLKSYLQRISYFASITNLEECTLESIFFGGGTPSLMHSAEVDAIIGSIMSYFPNQTKDEIEITLESNPLSGSGEFFKSIKSVGVNRVSIGIQSFNESKLKFLERTHSSDQAIDVIKNARSIFQKFSFDLICDSIKDTKEVWMQDLMLAQELCGTHISIYSLAIEKGAKFFTKHLKGEDLCLSDIDAIKRNEETMEFMVQNGFERYEVSNYAKLGNISKHNMMYWNLQDYIGVGCGAHSRFFNKEGVRMESIEHNKPEKWMPNAKKGAEGFFYCGPINKYAQFLEVIMMGLRISDGICISDIENRLGIDLNQILSIEKINHLCDTGLLYYDRCVLKLTSAGFMFVNKIVDVLSDIDEERKIFMQQDLVLNINR